MDELLTKIKQVEKQSIEDVERAKQDRDSSILAASNAAEERYEREIVAHHEKLKAEQEKEMLGFKDRSEGIVAKGRDDAERAKHISPADLEKAVDAAYKLVIRG